MWIMFVDKSKKIDCSSSGPAMCTWGAVSGITDGFFLNSEDATDQSRN